MSVYFSCRSILHMTVKSTAFCQTVFYSSSNVSSLQSKFAQSFKFQKSILKPHNVLRLLGSAPHENITSIQPKKRPIRKKKSLEDDLVTPGLFNVVAFASSEEYDLESLTQGLKEQDLYEPRVVPNEKDVVHAVAKYKVEKEPREVFLFRDGGVVFWNITDLESSNVLTFLRQYQQDSYSERLVQAESEFMNYKYHTEEGKASYIDKDGNFVLNPNEDNENLTLVKYTFSNAMFLSVKLGIWEASLEQYIDEIEQVTKDLKKGKRINMTRDEALRKHGELFALRHYLNLSSDLLDTPDFYWENEKLENLFTQVCMYFGINKRTKVMNEKINHCVALIELLSHHLADKHHIRLEWMIIILIMVEVLFEVVHYVDRYMH